MLVCSEYLHLEQLFMRLLKILWVFPSSLPYVSLYITWSPSLSLTDCIYTFVQRSSHKRKVHSLKSNHGFWVDWNLFYWRQPFWGTYREEGV